MIQFVYEAREKLMLLVKGRNVYVLHRLSGLVIRNCYYLIKDISLSFL